MIQPVRSPPPTARPGGTPPPTVLPRAKTRGVPPKGAVFAVKKNEECGSSCWAEAQRRECVLWEAGSQQQNKPAAATMVDGGDEHWLLL